MALTPEQIQSIRQKNGITPTAPAVVNDVSSKLDEAWGAPKPPTLTENIGSSFSDATNKIKSAYDESMSKINSTDNPIKKLGAGLEGGLGIASGVASAAASPITGTTKSVMEARSPDAIHPIDALMQTDTGKALIQKVSELSTAHPELTKNLGDALNLISTFAGGSGAKAVVPEIKAAASTVKESILGTAEQRLTKQAEKTTMKVKKVADEWAKPLTENSATFNKARIVAKKSGGDIPQFIAEHGINPGTHIEDGKFITEDTARSLRETAGKLSADTLRPSLQMADYTVPKTPAKNIVKSSLSYAKNGFHTTADDLEAVSNLIDKKIEALTRKYPDGMGLTDMHDEKITYSKNAGFNQFKSNADTNNAVANRAISDALDKEVLTKSPKDIPVEDFNSHLSKYYRAADYLESINGKKAPVSLGQQIARGVAKFGGAAIGGHVGSGVVSEFAGYQIGKAIEHALENLSNPARESFLKNLKITNPEAFTKVQEYMGKEQADRATRLALPEPNYIPLGAKKPSETTIKSVVAPKGLVGKSPKSGKFFKTYKSSPE